MGNLVQGGGDLAISAPGGSCGLKGGTVDLPADVRPREVQESECAEEQPGADPLADPIWQIRAEPIGPPPAALRSWTVELHLARSFVPYELRTSLAVVPWRMEILESHLLRLVVVASLTIERRGSSIRVPRISRGSSREPGYSDHANRERNEVAHGDCDRPWARSTCAVGDGP